MQLREIRFHEFADIYDLANKLINMNFKLDTSSIDQLAEQFIVGADGNTYLLQDILALPQEDAVLSPLKFISREGKIHSLLEIQKSGSIAGLHLIRNKELASTFCKINLDPKKLLNVTTENCGIAHDSFLFPMITPNEDNYECDAITTWLQQKKIHPLTNKPLETNELLPNHALTDLIWLNIMQRQLKKRRLANLYQKEKNLEKQNNLKEAIEFFNDEQNKLLPRLRLQKERLLHEKTTLNEMKVKRKELIQTYPDIQTATSQELGKKIERYQKRMSVLTHIGKWGPVKNHIPMEIISHFLIGVGILCIFMIISIPFPLFGLVGIAAGFSMLLYPLRFLLKNVVDRKLDKITKERDDIASWENLKDESKIDHKLNCVNQRLASINLSLSDCELNEKATDKREHLDNDNTLVTLPSERGPTSGTKHLLRQQSASTFPSKDETKSLLTGYEERYESNKNQENSLTR